MRVNSGTRVWIRRATRLRLVLSALAAVSAVSLLCSVVLSSAHAQDTKRITFYTAQTTYSLPVVDRNSTEYVGIFETLEPLGPVSAKADGNKWKLEFRDVESQFETGKTKAKVRGKTLNLTGPFLLDSGRGYIPLRSLKDVLSQFVPYPIVVREGARRVFVGVSLISFSGHKSDSGKVSFTFSSPVNPFIATEPGKLRMTFHREPVHVDAQQFTFDDKYISAASYSEGNGAAELTVLSSVPLLATFSADRKTITVGAMVPTQAQAPTQPPPTTGTLQQPPARVTTRPTVIIDPAHGGTESGAALADKIAEKDVTLAFARRLRRELSERGIGSALVRDGNVLLAMDERIQLINSSGAALYVCIHASGSGTGVHVFSATTAPKARKPLAFLPVDAPQAYYSNMSRVVATAVSTELLKRDLPGFSLAASVPPLNSIAMPAIAIEVAPPPRGTPQDVAGSAYQQSMASAIANAISTVRARLTPGGSQ